MKSESGRKIPNVDKAASLMKLKEEEKLAHQVARYMQKHYPDVIYRFDVAADLYVGPRKAGALKAKYNHRKGYPDLFIAEPKLHWDRYATFHAVYFLGLFIELKKSKSDVYLKDGVTFKAGDHIANQAEMLSNLSSKGYAAHFAWPENVFDIIDEYLE